jgi:hypothetical protein
MISYQAELEVPPAIAGQVLVFGDLYRGRPATKTLWGGP